MQSFRLIVGTPLALVVAALVAGCSRGDGMPSESEVLEAMARKPDACLSYMSLPIEIPERLRGSGSRSPTSRPGQATALESVGLMGKSTSVETYQKLYGGTFSGEVDLYTLSTKAAPYFRPNGEHAGHKGTSYPQGRLCFAKRHPIKIVGIEQAGKVNDRDAIIATYAYELKDVVPFSVAPRVRQAFPEIEQIHSQAGESGKCKAVLTRHDDMWVEGQAPETLSPCQIEY